VTSTTDFVLTLLLLLLAGGLLWLERARWLPLVARPPRAADGGATPGGYYWRLTRQSGLSPYAAWPFYMAAKVALAALVLLLLMRTVGFIWWTLLPAIVAFMIPDLVLASMRRQRQATIRRALSFFLDLLASLLQAGLGLEDAFARTAREGLPHGHPLAREAMGIIEELNLGRDRSLAFQMLAERTGLPELRSLASALAVGATMGGSVEATLKAQADNARARRREDGLKRLSVVNAQVLLPLMLCAFPVFIVMVFLPLALRLTESLQGLGNVLRLP
jgi:tight adherence protein C